ncbi:MAG: methyl-accepting chemotaxis protein, partial [Myxococcota bacterium]|nr:methyl-accepting chemotaxis protein [Myxococcota bacterium]
MSIRARVTAAVLGTTALALVAALATLLGVQRAREHDALDARARNLARLLAAQAAAPLAQADEEAVASVLAGLGAHPDVAEAAVYDWELFRVASFARRDAARVPTSPPPPGAAREPDRAVSVARIEGLETDESLGRVYVAVDATGAAAGMQRSLAIAGAVGVLALLPALLASRRLRDDLARPLDELARAAEQAARGDLSGRVGAERTDEIGSLARSFVRMREGLRGLTADVGAGAREVLSAAATVRTASESARERARSQDESVRATEERLHGMEATLEELAGVTRRLAGLTQDAAASASEVEASARSVADNMQELRASIESTTSAAGQSTALAEGIAGRVVRLDTAARGAVDAMGELGASVGDVADRAGRSRAQWEAAADEVGRGRRAAAETAEAMERLQDRFRVLGRTMGELEERGSA